MRKALKWAAIIFVGLIVIGALLPSEDKKSQGDDKAAKSGGVETAAEEPASTPEPTPEPTPVPVSLTANGPSNTTSDQVTIKGRVNLKGTKVKVNGTEVKVKGGKWTAVVAINGKGQNRYQVVAAKPGHGKDKTTVTVTRKLSAAERAVIRQEEAARRANRRALESAESYLAMSGFSKQGLYEQLSSPAGEGFSQAEAQYAVDHVDADWNKEAVESARGYLDMSPMSRSALIEQLSSSAGEGFTYEQALYAVNKVY
jgi:Host cell surface-exposed lipoprotein/Glucodextranase, domain B